MYRSANRQPPPLWLIFPLIILYVIGGAMGLRRWLALPPQVALPTVVGVILGAAALTVGLLFILGGLRTLTLRRAFAREVYRDREETRLVTTGPYGLTRNPLYFGVTTSLLGWALLFRSTVLLIMAALYVPVAWFAIRWEEKELTDRFGDEYLRYKDRVPRVFPGFRRR